MRFSLIATCLTTATLSFSCHSASAQVIVGDSFEAARAAARQELRIAKLESRHYWQIEYPRERRALRDAIILTEAEIRRLKLLRRDYRSFNKYSLGAPLDFAAGDLNICLLEAEMRLDELRHERNNLVRFHSDQARFLDLRVLEARRHLIELEGGEVIEIGVVEASGSDFRL